VNGNGNGDGDGNGNGNGNENMKANTRVNTNTNARAYARAYVRAYARKCKCKSYVCVHEGLYVWRSHWISRWGVSGPSSINSGDPSDLRGFILAVIVLLPDIGAFLFPSQWQRRGMFSP